MCAFRPCPIQSDRKKRERTVIVKEPSQRVRDILRGMTTEQKALQLSCVLPSLNLVHGVFDRELAEKEMPKGVGRMTQFASGFVDGPKQAAEGYNAIQEYIIEKAGVPAIIQNESSSGTVAADGTIFPVPIALASTFKPHLAYEMGKVIGEEGRAIGVHAMMSPVADVSRDARWGRVDETFGEDPLMCARFSSEEVHGIQGEDYTKNAAALAKHWVAYGMSEGGINCATINIEPRELFEVYTTPFAAAIKEHDMQQIMVTYSEIDGLPMSVNPKYTQKILRDDLGFNGIAVCDGMSIPRVINTQGMFASMAELAGAALKAGIDADTMITTVYNHIVEGVDQGLVDMADLDAAVLRTLQFREEMGLLDNPYVDPEKAEAVYADPKADELSAKIAQESITLLKNEDNLLPLNNEKRKIAVVGPFANNLDGFFGGYAYPAMMRSFLEMAVNEGDSPLMEGFAEMVHKMFDVEQMKAKMLKDPNKSFDENFDDYLHETLGTISLTDAIAQAFDQADVVSCGGSLNITNYKEKIDECVEAAKDADLVILAVGEITGQGKDATSGEGINHPDLTLPFHQSELVERIHALGKKSVLVLFNGRALALGNVVDQVDAIVEAWYPGPAGGKPIANVLSGAFDPIGHLPVTFPQISAQCPIYYGHKTGSGYMTINQKPDASVMQPLFPFGYGLSYTTFEYSDFTCASSVETGESFQVAVTVKNTGERKGSELVQIYSHSVHPTINRPIKELRAFKNLALKPGEAKRVTFTLDTRQFGYFNARDEFVIEARPQQIFVCNNSSSIIDQADIEFTGKDREILHDRVFDFGVETETI